MLLLFHPVLIPPRPSMVDASDGARQTQSLILLGAMAMRFWHGHVASTDRASVYSDATPHGSWGRVAYQVQAPDMSADGGG